MIGPLGTVVVVVDVVDVDVVDVDVVVDVVVDVDVDVEVVDDVVVVELGAEVVVVVPGSGGGQAVTSGTKPTSNANRRSRMNLPPEMFGRRRG